MHSSHHLGWGKIHFPTNAPKNLVLLVIAALFVVIVLVILSEVEFPWNQPTPVETNPGFSPEARARLFEETSLWCTDDGGWHYVGDLEDPDYTLPSRIHTPQNQTDDFTEVSPGVWVAHFDDPLFGEGVMRMTTLPDGSVQQEIIYDSVEFCQ